MVRVDGTVGSKAFSVRVEVDGVNAKLDVVNTDTFHASTDIALVSGIRKVLLLGAGAVDATGNGAANTLEGNTGRNVLTGQGGRDLLKGADGNDLLRGGSGNDRMLGGDGRDVLQGDGGNDRMTGGSGADVFVFRAGAGDDVITDFNPGMDRLRFDDAIWGGSVHSAAEVISAHAQVQAGDVVIDLGGGDTLVLDGLDSLSGLAARIDLF